MSRSNGSFVAKELCTFTGATAGLSAATAVANAWSTATMVIVYVIGCRDREQTLRLSFRRLVLSREVLMMD